MIKIPPGARDGVDSEPASVRVEDILWLVGMDFPAVHSHCLPCLLFMVPWRFDNNPLR